MTEYYFSAKPVADKPYHVKHMDLSIYSLEEFCYFFAHNIILLDNSIMTTELEEWIENELAFPVLAQSLRQIREHKGTYISYFSAILDTMYIYSVGERDEIKAELLQFANKNDKQRRKILGDQLYKRKKYESAMKEYYALTLDAGFEEENDEFKGKVWHNLGCCYGMCFLYERALECFKTAYSYGFFQETQNCVAYISKAYQERMNELEVQENSFVNYLDYTAQEGRNTRYEQLAARMEEYQRGVEE